MIENKAKKWKKRHVGNGWNDWTNLTCPECGTTFENVKWYSDWNYCPKCGTKLELTKEWEYIPVSDRK